MTTTTEIPTLTPIEVDAAFASIEPGAPPPLQLAAQLKLPPDELLEILARPHVAAFADAARAFVTARAEILARYTHITALQNLAEIAQNKEADIHSRLHAAIAILRDARGPGVAAGAPAQTIARRPGLSASPTTSPAPRFRLPPPPTCAAPAEPPGPSGAATSAQTTTPKPDQLTRDRPSAAPADAPSAAQTQPARPTAAPTAIHRAAGAPLARRDHHADRDPDTEHPHGAASPPSADRPP